MLVAKRMSVEVEADDVATAEARLVELVKAAKPDEAAAEMAAATTDDDALAACGPWCMCWPAD